MADPPLYPDSGDDTSVGTSHRSNTGTPGWVKVLGIITLVVVLLFVILLVIHGPGGYGPALHSLSGGPGGDTPLARIVAENHTRPGAAGSSTLPGGGHG